MGYHIDRCVCTGLSFDQLLRTARRRQLGLTALGEETGAGNRCATCRPYLKEALATGRTVFTELLGSEGR